MSDSDLSDYDGATARSSPKRIAEVVSKFGGYKRELVSQMSFEGMLKVPPIENLDRKLTLSLLNMVDIKKRAIRVSENNYIHLNATEVHRYLHIPIGPHKLFGLEDRSPSEKMDFIRFSIGSSCFDIDEKNSLKAAEEIVTTEHLEGMSESQAEQFKVSFVCFCMGCFLLAKYSSNHGIKDYWGSLMKPSEIHSYNFCQAVVDEIFESARHVQRESKANRQIRNVSGCHLFLQAIFLDYKRFGVINLPDIQVGRIQLFTNDTMRQLINAIHPSFNSPDGYHTPANGIVKIQKGKYVCNSNSSVSKAKTALPIMTNTQHIPQKPTSTAYLTEYSSRIVDKRLNGKQIDALRLHNARMKLFINNFKTKAFLDLQQQFLDSPISRDIFNCNVDVLLNQILDQVLTVSKSMHDHSNVANSPSFEAPMTFSDSKRSTCYESRADCSNIKRTKMDSPLTGKNLLPDLATVAGTSSSTMHTPPDNQAGFISTNSNSAEQNKFLSTTSSSVLGLDDLTFSNMMAHTPGATNASTESAKNVSFRTTQKSVDLSSEETQGQAKVANVDFNPNDTDEIDLNQALLNPDHIDTPVKKLRVQKGRLAKNPWCYGVPRKVVDKEEASRIYNWLAVTKCDILDSIWVNHSKPKPILVAGNDFKSVFTKGHNFTSDLIDLAIRRFNQKDRDMYGNGNRLRWMHPFESDFASKVLNGEPVLNSLSVRMQLFANTDDYEISNCRMIALPNCFGGIWSSYFWDMKESYVHIVDPTFELARASEIHDLHSPIVDELQGALKTCLSASFDGWDIDWTKWKRNYVKPFLPGKKSNESGILTLLALRQFNGSKFELPETEDSLSCFSKELLFDMLTIEGNIGDVPDVFIHYID